MHDTAYLIGGLVIDGYLPARRSRILEIGAQNVNGTLRDHAPRNAEYIGLDFEAGDGVDRVVTGRDDWNVDDRSFDLVMASSVFEHDQAFWRTFEAMCRKTADGGHVYVSAPSNGKIHRYPKDYWRFYPDAGLALEEWARSEGLEVTLVESFTAEREQDVWNDFCAVFRCGSTDADLNTEFVHLKVPCTNVITWRSGQIIDPDEFSEDMRLIADKQEEVERWIGHADHLGFLASQREEEWRGERERLVAQAAEGERWRAELDRCRNEAVHLDEEIARLKEAGERHAQALSASDETLRSKDASIEELRTDRETRDRRIGELAESAALKDGEIGRLAAETQTRDRRIVELAESAALKDGEIGRLAAETQARDRRIGELAESAAAKDGEIGRLAAERDDGATRIAGLEGALAANETEIGRLQVDDERRAGELQRLRREADASAEERRKQEAQVTDLRQRSNELKSRLAQRDEEVSQIWAEVERLGQERDGLQRTIRDMGEQLVEANSWVAQLALHRTNSERHIARLERSLARRMEDQDSRPQPSQALEDEIGRTRAELATVRDDLRQSRSELQAARDEFAEAAAGYADRLEAGGDELKRTRKDLSAVRAELDSNRETSGAARRELETAADDLARKGDALEKVYAEMAALSRMLVDAQDDRDRLERQNDWLRAVGTFLVEHDGRTSLLRPGSWSKGKRDRVLRDSGLFDAAAYASRYPDVETSGQEPLRHFIKHGIAENRQLD